MHGPPLQQPDLGGLSRYAPELAEILVRLSSDIALVVKPDGVIEKVVQSGNNPIAPEGESWVGRRWPDTVTGDTRGKIETLLKEVADTGVGRRREVNHPGSPGTGIPVAYTAIRLGAGGPLLAMGRDLRAIAAIQQRFLEVQRETEHTYWKARQTENRYQLLFQVASDAMLLVDAESGLVLEANRAAAQLFGVAQESLAGRGASFAFDPHSRERLEELFSEARGAGKHSELRVRLAGSLQHANVAVTPFRMQAAMRLLVRVRVEHRLELARPLPGGAPDQPDPVVVTDSSGRIVTANRAFLHLVRAGSEEQVRGRPLGDWMTGGDRLEGIVDRVRSQGLVQRADSCVLPADGRAAPVQLSASLLTEEDQERIGFTLYPVPAAPAAPHGQAGAGPLEGWLGTGTLPELLRRAAAQAEAQLLASALVRCGGDADASARLLGISRDELDRRTRAAELPPGAQPGEAAR